MPVGSGSSMMRARRKEISPNTALRGTPYQGLNTAIKNEYDNLSEIEIKHQLESYRDLLNDKDLIRNLNDNGRKIKQKIESLDEALIRVQARNIIRQKNEKSKSKSNANTNTNTNTNPIRQRLDFGGISKDIHHGTGREHRYYP